VDVALDDELSLILASQGLQKEPRQESYLLETNSLPFII
jgi:hypothetical protein